MNAAKIRLKRKTVKKEVQNHYDHDKDFFLSFLKSYIVEALCDFFGIEEITIFASVI
jgi:cyclopropane fatty-acyl-phospholipid synthase-like methyltransferase